MAPRRGGGGGGSFGSVASCASGAFSTKSSQAQIAFNAIFSFFNLVLVVMAFRGMCGGKGANTPGRWALIIAIFLSVICSLWNLVVQVLYECAVTSGNFYVNISLAPVFLRWLSDILLVGAVMVAICKRLHQIAGMHPRVLAIAHGVLAAIFSLFYFIAVCLSAAITALDINSYSSYSSDSDYYDEARTLALLEKARRGVMTTAGVFVVIGMISTAINLSTARSGCGALKNGVSHSYSLNSSRVPMLSYSVGSDTYPQVLVPLLAASSFCYAAMILISEVVVSRLASMVSSDDGYISAVLAFQFLNMFFNVAMFYFALRVAAAAALGDSFTSNGTHPPVQQQQNYAYVPPPGQEQQYNHGSVPVFQPHAQHTTSFTSAPQPYQSYQAYEPYRNQTTN
ncbi:hypothetical protein FQN50_009361 [Emmonsiellopsis sp. PD_5]|nr:hypothetical protein FQN50_009361 [Emmonsiellopsis sp. PD_5]